MSSGADVTNWRPSTEEEKTLVLDQLRRMVQDSRFNHSKRYPSFLKYVVDQALAGQAHCLKERTLGVEVFGRDPSYDTTDDPIVRVTAAEIRKRIAQYYQDPGHDNELRLLLPSGSYAPIFVPGSQNATMEEAVEEVLRPMDGKDSEPSAPAPASASGSGSKRSSSTTLAMSAGLLLLLAVCVLTGWQLLHRSALDEFWKPFTHSSDPILFCIADQVHYSTITLQDASNPAKQTTLSDQMVTVIFDDVSPLVNIAGILQSHGRTYKVKAESATTFTDLRQGPAVFIGAYDNSWTLRLTSPLRYHFGNNADMTQFWIEDRQNPSSRIWLLDRTQQSKGTYKDYAIVARYWDSNTDRPVVIAAGIARGGTVSAGEFLMDSAQMDEIARKAPSGWSRRGMEVVLETQVIDGRSGPPRVDALYFW